MAQLIFCDLGIFNSTRRDLLCQRMQLVLISSLRILVSCTIGLMVLHTERELRTECEIALKIVKNLKQ